MKKIIVVIVASSLLLTAGSDMLKRYKVRSAKILYEIKGSGDVMGMVQTQTKGKKRLIFSDYGAKEITELVKVTKTTTNGKSKVEKLHTLQYMNGAILYSVDFKQKKIIRMKNPALAMGALFGGGKSMAQTGEAMMRKMGGKKIGTDKVLGYSCDVWDLMGVKQCIYQGIPLRVVSDLMGMKSTEVAVKASFNLSLGAKDLKLPDYPIMDQGGRILSLDRDRLEAIDAKETNKDMNDATEAAEMMGTMFQAAADAGMSFNSKSKPTKAQEEAMANAMMPMMQRKFKQQKEEIIRERVCLSRANTLAQAKRCAEGTEMEDEPLRVWNASEKKKVLRLLDQGIKAMECAMQVKTMAAVEQCFPKEMR